jgi:hypothetical protein
MTLARPFKRIARPFKKPDGDYVGGIVDGCYLADDGYAPDRTSVLRSYHSIESDFRTLFDFIEPHDENLKTYSTRLYEIFLRASTEFESNCKAVLSANNYKREGNWNMDDYRKLDSATRLSSYRLKLTLWSPTPKILQPMQPWASGNALPWYQDYNTVKHNRSSEFYRANLSNTLEAVAALFIVVFSQFHILSFSSHEIVESYSRWPPWIVHANSMFWVQVPGDWKLDECYGFANADLLTLSPKFDAFPF